MSRSRWIALLIACLALCAAPSAASGAIVNNGDFETGNFSGWHEDYLNPEVGRWFNYTGTSSPIEHFPIPAPPQGAHAAITDQGEVSRQILYQDVTLPPGGSVNQLSLSAYYSGGGIGGSAAPFASPDTLSLDVENEQYRIDVMKPSAPLDSVSSSDVLLTLLRTTGTSPGILNPTTLTADLSPYAGQTVRIRFAVVVTDHTLNGGVDAVAIKTNGFTIGDAVRNKKKGTAMIPVTVPDAGTLSLTGSGVKPSSATKSVAVGAGTTNLLVKATGKKKRKLQRKGKATVSVTITYTPTGTNANNEQATVKLKKKRKQKT